jgi:hypothetical protein
MCHLDIIHYLFCNHWRYDLAHCGFRGHVLCRKETTDGTIHDSCPQCHIFSTPEHLKKIQQSGSELCENSGFDGEGPVPDLVQELKSSKSRKICWNSC